MDTVFDRARPPLDNFARLVKLVFPHARASHRNCYADALRGAARLGKGSDELSATVSAYNAIVAMARWEVKQRKGASDSTGNRRRSEAFEAQFTCPPMLTNGEPFVIPKDGVRVWLTECDGV